MKPLSPFIVSIAIISLVSCSKRSSNQITVMAIPVYGQSLALGEQATRITDFDSLIKHTHHVVLTENLDENFGYLSDTHFKQWMKKIMRDRHRAFELSVYGMSEELVKYLENKTDGDSIILSIFPGGQGATSIVGIGRGSVPYKKFMEEIASAYEKAKGKGWNFVVPAFCWMQGEDDMLWKKSADYKRDLKRFETDLNQDIKTITKQQRDVVCISYQTNCLTLAKDYEADNFNGKGTYVSQGQLELIAEDPLFMGSGPTYPYNFIDNGPHIDGLSQKILGHLQGLSAIRLLESKKSKGLVPEKYSVSGKKAIITYDVPSLPLVIDTILVRKAENYGFSVINRENENIIENVTIKNDQVQLQCNESPLGCKVRYAVNGVRGKTGTERARGNLRDSQGSQLTAAIGRKVYPLHNWSYQFDVLMK